jgi:hypothetical protein
VQSFFFLLPEFLDAGSHGFPQKKLLENMPLLSGQVGFRIKGLPVSEDEKHQIFTRYL